LFVRGKKWRSGYLWQDSFLTHFNRLLGCSLFGHREVKKLVGDNMKKGDFCFNCYRDVRNGQCLD
jgi:hypothetical protein